MSRYHPHPTTTSNSAPPPEDGSVAEIERWVLDSLPRLSTERWYRDKGRAIAGIRVLDACRVPDATPISLLVLVELAFESTGLGVSSNALYALPVVIDTNRIDADRIRAWSAEDDAWAALALLARQGASLAGRHGDFVVAALPESSPRRSLLPERGSRARALGAEQSNTSVVVGERCLVKLYRRIDPGPQPEIEVLRHFADSGAVSLAPSFLAAVEYVSRSTPQDRRGVVLVEEFVPGTRDAWTLALEDLRGVLQGRSSVFVEERAASLGRLTAELHRVLRELSSVPPATSLLDEVTRRMGRLARDIESAAASSPPSTCAAIRAVLERVARATREFPSAASWGPRTRVHGDYHLGQVLYASGRLFVVDFEGEPAAEAEERRRGHSVYKDVAGMLRSFDYARAVVLDAAGLAGNPTAARIARAWASEVRDRFVSAYHAAIEERADGDGLLPDSAQRRAVLDALETEKALYELLYELRNRPTWVGIPLAALEIRVGGDETAR
jgi:maltokinase